MGDPREDTMQCPSCQTTLPEDAKYCLRCGARLSTVDQTGQVEAGEVDNHKVDIGGGAYIENGVRTSGDFVTGDKIDQSITVGAIIHNPPQQSTKALSLPDALRHYLDNLVAAHQHLHLQGIRAGHQPLSVELEQVYVSLTIIEKYTPLDTQHRDGSIKAATIEKEAMDSSELTIPHALRRHKRLVIIGDPGSGKTTLLSYLALTYARALRDDKPIVYARLELDEADHLPILLPLRDFGRHLKLAHPDPGKDGPLLLLDYLRAYYANQQIALPENFFEGYLTKNRAVVLLDGMDEVADSTLRARVARIIEKFTMRYEECRFVVTSRQVGYTGSARLGEGFCLTKVRDFTAAEVRRFLRDWTRAVEALLAQSAAPEVLRLADVQSERLTRAIEHAPRISPLAANPLLLTVIALVHRYRGRLPERRSDLYEEALEVLLGWWDEAKQMDAEPVLVAGRVLDTGDRRSLLEPIALWLHDQQRRELEKDELHQLLLPRFLAMAQNKKDEALKALDTFLQLIAERSGLLLERGLGVYGFAHLTFQEYLAARAISDRDDFITFTLKRLNDPWWREVILLEAGYLSNYSKQRLSKLIRAIIQTKCAPEAEPEPCHHLHLAAECLLDAGTARLDEKLPDELKAQLKQIADVPLEQLRGKRHHILRKVAAMNTLSSLESDTATNTAARSGRFWKAPWGEPEWVSVPAGEFSMGSNTKNGEPMHRVFVSEFKIARVLVTNAQYALYAQDVKIFPHKGKENHPVVNISWHGAQSYCHWLSNKIGCNVQLPTEAEWEKAARGDQDKRDYPWGDTWKELRCNSEELALGDTSPVGLFINGASPYDVLDMVGNVWEWCQSKYWPVPYTADDRREVLDQSSDVRVLRGGSWRDDKNVARCDIRNCYNPE